MASMKKQAVAIAAAAALCAPVHATIIVSGDVGLLPTPLPIGPGNTVLTDSRLYIGSPGIGQVEVNAGSTLDVGSVYLATNGTGNGRLWIHGAGSRVRLDSDTVDTLTKRLSVGDWGTARVLVEVGGLLDGRFSPGTCAVTSGAASCGTIVGNAAGSFAELIVRDASSRAEFFGYFNVGQAGVSTVAAGGFDFGTVGGITNAKIEVSNGGFLRTDRATVGYGPSGTAANGSERSFSSILVSGAGSVWNIAGGTLDAQTSSLSTAFHANATVNLTVSDGGRIDLSQVPNTSHFINLSSGAGKTDMVVTGAGSAVNLNSGIFQVGRGLNGTARLDVSAGGVINDAFYFSTGRGGSNGRTVVDGANSRITVNRSAVPGSPDAGAVGAFDVGRDGGTGQVDISNGGRVEVLSGAAATERARNVRLGFGAASQGTLNLSGADSRFIMDVASALPGGGPTEALNPYFSVGYQGVGYFNVSGGAKLLLNGGAVSTVADGRGTMFIVGGRDDTNTGGQGFATLSGAGTELRMSGSDTLVYVGRGPGSTGQMTVSAGALVSATNLLVGRNGGAVGVMTIDNATVDLSGQQLGSVLAGAGAVIGSGTGSTGILNMNNGALLNISNVGGSAGLNFAVGGSSTAATPGGDGVLQMNGGSRIQLSGGPAGSAAVTIGRDGAAFARLRGASQLDVGDGSLYVGRLAGGDGTLIASENSSISAAWVGVGRNRAGSGSVDGGTGTFILNNATLNATDVVIGTNGFLGGTAGSINVTGSVTNYGIFSPGNSPGTFTINGSYVAGAGSRLVLEVESDGQGGFLTDLVQFGAVGAMLDLAALNVEFRFLGDTNPEAFNAVAGRFDIDTFVKKALAGGGFGALDDAAFAGVTFSARADAYTLTNFSYTAGGVASFVAVPVPEPGTWAMWLAGGIALLALRRRRLPA